MERVTMKQMIVLFAKKLNIHRQTTFVCATCGVPLCAPVLTERIQAPRDCFRKYHQNTLVSSKYSSTSLDDVSTVDSEDEWFEKKQVLRRKDVFMTTNLWKFNVFDNFANFWLISVLFGR